MHEAWRLLGFDARVSTSAETRASVDSEVWPSIFDVLSLRRPDWTGPVQQLWDDEERLKGALDDAGGRLPAAAKVIAVAVLPRTCGIDADAHWSQRLGEIRPPRIDRAWTLLGFDVADEYLESAITMPMQQTYNDLRLNDWSLFESIQEAEQFTAIANQQYPQQSPFCVYGIWELT